MPEQQIDSTTLIAASATAPEPPLADPGVTPELMTPEQYEVFALKEHARILIAGGQATLEEALERNWISQADAAAWRLLGGEAYNAPSAVIQAPANPPSHVKKTGVVETAQTS